MEARKRMCRCGRKGGNTGPIIAPPMAGSQPQVYQPIAYWCYMAHSPGIMLDSQVKGRFRPVYCQEKRDICRTKKCQSYDAHKQKCNLLNIELN